MPIRYILSCFWEGHEGSFLLWSFWHMVLGMALLRWKNEWTAPVMAFVAIANVFLGSMVLGVYFGDFRIGNSPFLLLRQSAENIGMPWTTYPDYLERFPQFMDGRGLNPLLQNYWMTIHPPTVFFGFASTIIPAAFAIAGLWRRRYHEWIKPALPWTFLGIMVLGVGILMGGAWAYEALSFGGFWAWDPVENSSLVPWLIIVSAGHVMLINRHKARSTYTALLLACASFIFVIYSNFLTNSGVLGDTSVHAFTDNGLTGQLSTYLAFFIAIPAGMLMVSPRLRRAYWVASGLTFLMALISGQEMIAIHVWLLGTVILTIIGYRKHYPAEETEEKLWSREFWMFIGSLVIVMSALQITFMTSKPVFNLMASPLSGPIQALADMTGWEALSTLADGQLTEKSQDEVIADYNRWQTPFAMVVLLLVSFTQFLRWKDTDFSKFAKQILFSAILAILLTAGTALFFGLSVTNGDVGMILLFFASWWAVTGNADYLIRVAKGNAKVSGSSIAHVGFGLVLLGAAVSTSQSEEISQNSSMTDIRKLNEEFDNQKDILLFQHDTLAMGDYFVSFRKKQKDDINVYFSVDYMAMEPRDYKAGERILALGGIYQAKEDHRAGDDMMSDLQQYWERTEMSTADDLRGVRLWSPFRSGERLFTLEPRIQLNPKFGNVPEPDTKHYLGQDLYTHIRYGQLDADSITDPDGYLPFRGFQLQIGDTLRSGARLAILDSLIKVSDTTRYDIGANDIAVKAKLRIVTPDDTAKTAEPLFVLRDQNWIDSLPYEMSDDRVRFLFSEIRPEEGAVTIKVAEHKDNIRDFIVMQAIVFPWINILWVGIIVMAMGTFIAVVQRFRGRLS
jgi:cytochrome c-type biogenesis protein CcmF